MGHVQRLPSGRWQARYRAADRRERARNFARKADALRWLREAEGSIDRGSWVDPRRGGRLFVEYAVEWLEHRPLRLKTVADYRSLLRTHLDHTFGAMPLDRITPEAVRKWHAAASALTPARAAKAFRLARAIMNQAVEDRLVVANPFRVRGAGLDRSAERPLITPQMALDLADAMPARLRALVLLAAFGGLRLGELMGLERRHVDIGQRVVTVDGQLQRLAGVGLVRTEPKTAAGYRRISLPPFLVDAIEEHLREHEGERLFPGSEHTIGRAWARAKREVGAPTDLHLHDLRHLGGTIAAQAGGTTREVMARLGHSTPRAALIYQHAASDRDRAIADRIGELVLRRIPGGFSAEPAPIPEGENPS